MEFDEGVGAADASASEPAQSQEEIFLDQIRRHGDAAFIPAVHGADPQAKVIYGGLSCNNS